MQKIAFILAVIFLFAFSCEEKKVDKPQIFEVITIGKGDLNGTQNIPKQNLVITNQTEWTDLLNVMETVSNITETNVDFTRFHIIAVFDEVKGNGGHSIDITEVVEAEDSINVKVENLKTGDATLIITQPYHIVKFTKSSKPVVFI
ncbi:MAG: protease complex subunit PrcB family protein [Cyclobacteriaceae bacterium]|nr:MAG: protease complex subunit PrcB family protein [Cyclobacteriaceae bacterium]